MAQKQIRELRALRESLYLQLHDISAVAVSAQTDRENKAVSRMFQVRYEVVKKIYGQIASIHSDIVTKSASLSDSDLSEEHAFWKKVDDAYFSIECIFNELFPPISAQMPVSDTDSIQSSQTRLPKLTLRSFDGKLENWNSFIQVFNRTIHNNAKLVNVEKFEYLLGCLTGEPLNLIRAIVLSDTNYLIAYNTLIDRYDNKRELASYYWNKLHSLSKLKDESPTGLRNLFYTFKENLAWLRALNFADSLEDFMLFSILLEKLDASTRRLFEAEIRNLKNEIPKFDALNNFIESQCRVLASDSAGLNNTTSTNRQRSVSSFVAKTSTSEENCFICKHNHVIYSCPTLKSRSPADRFKLIKDKRLCVNCLRPHQLKNCSSKSTCRICHKSHHTLLHFETSVNPVASTSGSSIVQTDSVSPEEVTVSTVNALSSRLSGQVVLLSTALVNVQDSMGALHTLRAVLDSGSEASFITAKCAQTLNLRGRRDKVEIQGVGGRSNMVSLGSVQCRVCSRESTHREIILDAHIIPHIASVIPSQSLPCKSWDHIANLKLADPDFHISRRVDLLLGADVYAQIMQPGIIISPNKCGPSAVNTIFGWVLSGTVQSEHNRFPVKSFHTTLVESSPELEIERTMKRFWEVEEVPVISENVCSDECENIYVHNYSRLTSGRFVVPLPFRNDMPHFPKSKEIAIRRFFALEHRLKKDPTLNQMYVDFMKDYLDSGHMELTSPTENINSYYIPHHSVLRFDSPSTKLRVVFDASAKAANNQSLNDTLYVGSKLQQDIVQILLKFRLHSVVFIADIKQMYRQIQVAPEFWDYQRIIWRFNPIEPLSEFRLKTVTYGVSAAPFLALRTIQQLAVDGQDMYPLASQVLKTDIFVDDVVTGSDSVAKALILQKELIQLLESGGFPLRKWSSNHPALLDKLPSEHCRSSFSFDSDPSLTLKVLGLQWSPSTDVLTYRVTLIDRPCTKRGILSEIARIFDPIGYLTPVTFHVKHLLQQFWRLGIAWDDPPSDQLARQWSDYKSEISRLSEINIERQLIPDRNIPCQIHGFCDASEAGYAAVAYIRFLHNDSYTVRLIMAKSKVSPKNSNKLTIPRLELCGAVLLSKLLHFVINTYSDHLNISDVFAWTDSSIVFNWIRSPPHRWKTFVANRVAYIQQKSGSVNWYHVSSADNPADCASRGILPSNLVGHSQWWFGPLFLKLPPSQWPQSNVSDNCNSSCEEANSKKVLIVQFNSDLLDQLLNRFSSLRTICNIVANIFRFKFNCKHRSDPKIGPIDSFEFHAVLLHLVKLVQMQAFHKEFNQLESNQLCSKPFRKLNLFLDDQGILRVGGRLRHSSLPFEHKFPALLPQKHRLTKLIIEDTHQRHFHPGFKTLHYLLLQNFWILSAHRAIRNCLANCYRCFRANPRTLQPPMSDLPPLRLQQLKAFQIVGVDFGGPFTITMNRHRGAKTLKAYLCLFVCCSTRALHLEIVSDLSTDGFLAAFRRFIARRGKCSEIHSDCGTNFVGASRQLVELAKAAATSSQIRWIFNPPLAPHFGGIWEAGIKSVKTHLARVIGGQILSFEELYTVFVQVESVLNSRPLSPTSADPNDLNVLTPGHFLTLAPLTTFPEPDLTGVNINRLSRWQLVQQMHQHFWKRWSNEFLHTLQQRSKWTNPAVPITVGALVLIKDELSPPLKWRLGRIIEVHPGRDNVIRVVTLKTNQGLLKRPVVKLCPLPHSF